MISKHCGQRLKHLYGEHGAGQPGKKRSHAWICVVCKRVFKQRARMPKEKP